MLPAEALALTSGDLIHSLRSPKPCLHLSVTKLRFRCSPTACSSDVDALLYVQAQSLPSQIHPTSYFFVPGGNLAVLHLASACPFEAHLLVSA